MKVYRKLSAKKLAAVADIVAGIPTKLVSLKYNGAGLHEAIAAEDPRKLGTEHVALFLAFHPMFRPQRMSVASIKTVARALINDNPSFFCKRGRSVYDDGFCGSDRDMFVLRIETHLERLAEKKERRLAERSVTKEDAGLDLDAENEQVIQQQPAARSSVSLVGVEQPVAVGDRIRVKAKPEQRRMSNRETICTPQVPFSSDATWVPSTTHLALPPMVPGKVYLELNGRWVQCN